MDTDLFFTITCNAISHMLYMLSLLFSLLLHSYLEGMLNPSNIFITTIHIMNGSRLSLLFPENLLLHLGKLSVFFVYVWFGVTAIICLVTNNLKLFFETELTHFIALFIVFKTYQLWTSNTNGFRNLNKIVYNYSFGKNAQKIAIYVSR